jgi:putative ABC transport system permease protein
MNLWQGVIDALESVVSNKLRSALTILGIVIGVAAVIAMLSVGKGAQSSITGSINSIGTNVIFVTPGNRTEKIYNPKPLTLADAKALSDPAAGPDLVKVAPTINRNVDVSFGGETESIQISGVTPEYETVRNYPVDSGQFITQEQVLGKASVALIGVDVAENFFGDKANGLGESIRIAGQPFRVTGILKAKGGSSFGSQDNVIFIPLTTAQSRLGRRGGVPDAVDMIFVEAASAEVNDQAVEEITQIMRTRHRIGINPDDFTIFSQKDILATASSITGILTIFLGGVAGISLLVGGIGIMNIMLVSVTERTREIGLRKALGATKRDILLQFLTESSILSLLGGIMGIMLGWLIAFVIGKIAAANGNSFTAIVTADSVVLATVFSTCVGLFFGIYPANRAANLQPVEALRSE